MGPSSLRRYRAERLLQANYSRLRGRVLAAVRRRLASRGLGLDQLDLEGCYAQAWHGLYNRLLAGEPIANLAAWLVVVCERRAIEELRSRKHLQLDDGEDQPPVDRGADQLQRFEDARRLRQLFEGLVLQLTRRERQAVALCYLQGLTRAQAAATLGISERRLQRLLEGNGRRPGASAKVAELLELVGADRWCERQGSLMRAYAFGVLDPQSERYAVARRHQLECPSCRRYVLALRGLAAVVPPPLPLLGAALWGGAGARLGGASAGASGGAALGGSGGGLGMAAPAALKAAACALSLGLGAAALELRHDHTAQSPHRPRPALPPPASIATPPPAAASTPALLPAATGSAQPRPQRRAGGEAKRRPFAHASQEFSFEGQPPAPPPPANVATVSRVGPAHGPPARSARAEFSFEGSGP